MLLLVLLAYGSSGSSFPFLVHFGAMVFVFDRLDSSVDRLPIRPNGHEKVPQGPTERKPSGLILAPQSSLADRNTELRQDTALPFAYERRRSFVRSPVWTLVRDGGVQAGEDLVPVASGYKEELNLSRTSLTHRKILRAGVFQNELSEEGILGSGLGGGIRWALGRYARAVRSRVGRPVALVQQITTLNPFWSPLSSRTVRCR